MKMTTKTTLLLLLLLALVLQPLQAQHHGHHGSRRDATVELRGRITSAEGEVVDYAGVYLKGTSYGAYTDAEGRYTFRAPAGDYTLVVSAIGHRTIEQKLTLARSERRVLDFTLRPDNRQLDEVVVTVTGVSRLRRSAYNAVAVDATELRNTTKTLGDALAKTPGLKLRESGGVGSDLQVMLDGFSGKHVKVFIDGVPQEGVGSSFGLNNIPAGFAQRIEVYRGVVPVGFGTDALGGVINIVTNQQPQGWHLDASYSYGSFNTHKSYVNFGQTLRNGFTYEINAFQNYSDNDYHIDANNIEIFTQQPDGFVSSRIDPQRVRVKRFNDTYHNEAVAAKIGITGKPWADRLMLGVTYSHMYQEVQTGVRQTTVYGDKHRRGHSLMPSLEYRKRNLLVQGLDLVVTANYNRNATTNVDTSYYHYNWYADRYRMNTPGEQARQHSRADNDNWNGTFTLNYRLGQAHTFTFNHVLNAFHRSNTSLLAVQEAEDAIAKETRKNISGLSYRFIPSDRWNLSVFGKYYRQYVAGPLAEDATQSNYLRTTRTVDSWGYGAAGTYFILPGLQLKLSYEKAYRLPTIEEMFGDEDLEMGDIGIRPENSDNLNLNLSYSHHFGRHALYAEGGLVYRDTKDYIQRNITDLSGGKEAATYINYGKVQTKGYNLSLRYGFSHWLSLGGNFTQMNIRDKQRTQIGSTVPNVAYGARMPNVPYRFADMDVSLYWRNLGAKGNTLSLTYDNQYLHSFSYYSEIVGSSHSDYIVPDQFSHNLTLAYSIRNGRYNLSFECRNFTDEALYDNFSLQKAGRAFYGKIRVCFGN